MNIAFSCRCVYCLLSLVHFSCKIQSKNHGELKRNIQSRHCGEYARKVCYAYFCLGLAVAHLGLAESNEFPCNTHTQTLTQTHTQTQWNYVPNRESKYIHMHMNTVTLGAAYKTIAYYAAPSSQYLFTSSEGTNRNQNRKNRKCISHLCIS